METGLSQHTNRIGKRGAWVVPANLRHRYGLEEGTLVVAEPRPDGILLKPAIASPVLTNNYTAKNSIWNEWFELMGKVEASTTDIASAKTDGRR